MAKIEWVKARCPVCGQEYEYPEGGYKPHTCGSFECVQKWLHPELKGTRILATWLRANRQN